eukprot:TRINITY_DN38101_c0_g1_i1.p1 TRINITY_DN38101_c0_g1~~TRINITY_DN38101_c0_g1_i1.p1  ORF type:complete len:471 (+),score=101.71 TRINITY_DN38101_c0_g1_i1:51-1415(+)
MHMSVSAGVTPLFTRGGCLDLPPPALALAAVFMAGVSTCTEAAATATAAAVAVAAMASAGVTAEHDHDVTVDADIPRVGAIVVDDAADGDVVLAQRGGASFSGKDFPQRGSFLSLAKAAGSDAPSPQTLPTLRLDSAPLLLPAPSQPPTPPVPFLALNGRGGGGRLATSATARLKIVTGGDAAAVEASRKAILNQRRFAQRHGYAHEVHEGNCAEPWVPYWHKINVLLRELHTASAPEVVVWMDLDVVVTNPTQKMFERILDAYPGRSVILTEDAQRGGVVPGTATPVPGNLGGREQHARRLVNTGVILVRRGPDAVRVLDKLFEYGQQYREAAYSPQAVGTLHEQDAFNALLGGHLRHTWSRHVAVIKQRSGSINLNTFARGHYDASYKDPELSEWTVGDFTAHCTGLRKQQRAWCVDDAFDAAEVAIASDCGGCIYDNSSQTEVIANGIYFM